jgi:2-polyprenyl-3-methyl-5-hydroxy-6-metoxy-1,4-benzoquinol methylase
MKKEMYSHIQQVEQTHWWYVARRKIIFDWVLRLLAVYPNPRVLDIGCGTGFNLDYLQSRGYDHVVGLDFSTEALSFCRSRQLTQLICSDGTRPPLQQQSFDVILALDLIEHLEDDTQAIRSLANLLKPCGSLFIFTPAFQFLWGLQDEVSHHYRRYTATELRQKLAQAGLSITKLTYTNTFLFPLIWAGRRALRLAGNNIKGTSENDLHPGWSNGLLQTIFAAERPLLRYMNFPVGVSLLCVAQKLSPPKNGRI